jgi:hypothetical protein
MTMPPREDEIIEVYCRAKMSVVRDGYGPEIEWQRQLSIDSLSETQFLREAAWVVLSSGMRESIVRGRFPRVSAAFLDWESSDRITKNGDSCRINALACFNHRGKIDAILEIVRHVYVSGFLNVKGKIMTDGLKYLSQFPYIGPVTSFHLAKNIGFQVVKPDRHLTRIATSLGYDTPHQMCLEIATAVDEKISVVDLVLWRFASLNNNYIELFTEEREFI